MSNYAKRYTRKEQIRAVELYESGMSSLEVADKIGCSSTTVISWVKAAGKMRSLKDALRMSSKYDLSHVNRAAGLYNAGMSTTQVGNIMDIPPPTVRRWLRLRGKMRDRSEAIKMANRHPSHPMCKQRRRKIDRVVSLRLEGYTCQEVAEKLGVHRETVVERSNTEYGRRKLGPAQ